jgi:hypothetical protein
MKKRFLFKKKLKKVSVSTGKMLFDYKTFLFTEYIQKIKSGTLSPAEIDLINGRFLFIFQRINSRLLIKGYELKN